MMSKEARDRETLDGLYAAFFAGEFSMAVITVNLFSRFPFPTKILKLFPTALVPLPMSSFFPLPTSHGEQQTQKFEYKN